MPLLLTGAELSATGGGKEGDRQLIRQQVEERQAVAVSGSGVRFMPSRGQGVISRYNPARILFGGMMYVYQGLISPQLPSECLYHTSCSAFSMELISEFGFTRGIIFTSDRLMRCNRVAALDIHPFFIHESSGKAVEGTGVYRSVEDKSESNLED